MPMVMDGVPVMEFFLGFSTEDASTSLTSKFDPNVVLRNLENSPSLAPLISTCTYLISQVGLNLLTPK